MKRVSVLLGVMMMMMMMMMMLALAVSTALADSPAVVYTNPTEFEAATQGLGAPTVIDFDEIDASPVDNTFEGRDPFDGSSYAGQGITFSNPNDYPLYISPGGLFWNPSNSLSVGRFPFDPYTPYLFENDDDLVVTLEHPSVAVGLVLVDNGSRRTDEYVQFLDADGSLIEQVGLPSSYVLRRAFVGIVSPDQPVASINIVEAPNDGDDVNYDEITFFSLIQATVDILPNTLNLKSGGEWIYAYVELPEDCDVSDLDLSTVTLEGSIVATSRPTAIGDYGDDGINNFLAKFDRQALFDLLDGMSGDVELTLRGELGDGRLIEGSDTVTLISLGKD